MIKWRNWRCRIGWGQGATLAVLAFAWLSLCGCAGPAQEPVNLSEPGWRVRQEAVVWRPRGTAPELMGELLVAVNPDGRRLIQLSKQTLPVVTAQESSAGWTLSSSLRSGRFGGHGAPTDRTPWFQFTSLPPSAPVSARWHLESDTNGWKLTNPATGESVEGSNVP